MIHRASTWRVSLLALGLLSLGMLAAGNEGPTCVPVSPVDSPCLTAADCEGQPVDDCVGEWTCLDALCVWACAGDDCVEEGGSVPVVPDAPECCPGLAPIPCSAPGANGLCMPCAGASYCARCGDGACGLAENACNCPADCQGTNACEQAGGFCVTDEITPWATGGADMPPVLGPCPEGSSEVDLSCGTTWDPPIQPDRALPGAGKVCCMPDTPCVGEGGEVMPPYDQCCLGLVAVSDCQPGVPCPISLKFCVACGDGSCDAHETPDNCPADCANPVTCTPEGEAFAIVPSALPCCEGLVAVGCDVPDGDGPCLGCDGASYCTRCGDGDCGPAENACRCPEDCGEVESECEAEGGVCVHAEPGLDARAFPPVSCPSGYTQDDFDCPESDPICCVKDEGGPILD
jgi:hypothetical protein